MATKDAAKVVSEKLVRLAKNNNLPQVDDYGAEIAEDAKQAPWVEWSAFNVFIGLVICLNAATIGLETDQRADNQSDATMWYAFEIVFTLIFLTELVARLYFYGWRYFGSIGDARNLEETFEFVRINAWNIFDFVVVVIAVLDTFILVPIGLGGNARFVTFLRFVRLIRLIRVIRLFRIFKELWLVASGLLDSLRTLFWVCVLLGLFLEICAIITTLVIGHNDELYDPYFEASGGWDHETYFKTVIRSMLTLFQIMTLDSWSDEIVRHVGKQQPGMIVFFIAFIAITVLGVLNVIVGIVVEATLRTSQLDETNYKKTKEKQRAMVFSQLKEIFENADVDGSGTLSLDEVIDAMSKPEVHNKLRMIEFPADRPAEIFNLLDYDGKGELHIEDFITGCIRMKGQAKSKDLLVAQVAVNTLRAHFDVFEKEMATFRRKIDRLQDTANAMLGHGERIFLSTQEYRLRHPEVKDHHNVPRMPTQELLGAPWLQQRRQGGERTHSEALALAEKVGTPAGHGLDSTSTPAYSMDARNGDGGPGLLAIQNAMSNPGLRQLALEGPTGRPPAPPERPPPPALADAPRAGMLANTAHDGANELALVQVPGAMPPSLQ